VPGIPFRIGAVLEEVEKPENLAVGPTTSWIARHNVTI
jgi:hypothetical protein